MTPESIVHGWIERLVDEYRRLHVELVRTPSVTGEETACQKIVQQRLTELGVFERAVFADNASPYVPTGRDYRDRPSLVGRIRGTGEGPTLLLNAHIDTAPVEDDSSWTHPPFGGVIEAGKLFGRGALDDKAGVAMLLCLAEAFRRSDVRLPGDLLLEVVIEDEDSGNGTLACTEAGYTADAGIIIDGTWPLRIIDAHLGQVWLEVEIKGSPAAACVARRGVNPIDVAMTLIADLQRFVADRNREQGLWSELTDPFFANVGRIDAGVWAGAIPERCRFAVQWGFPPPWTPDAILAAVRQRWSALIETDDRIRLDVRLGSLQTTAFVSEGRAMIAALKDAIARVQSPMDAVRVGAVTGHCDLRHLRRADGRPTDACLYGPGGGGNPHIPDEFYLLDHFIPVARTIASALLGWR